MKKIVCFLSFLLIFTLILPSVSFHIAAEDIPDFKEKNKLYSLDFSALTALPEEIEYGYKGNGASFGYVAENPSLEVELDNDKGALFVSGANADSFIAFPSVDSDSYFYEVEMTVTSEKGSLGLANNIYDNLDGSTAGAQWLAIYVGGSTSPYSIRKTVNTDFSKNSAETPKGFENIKSGEAITLGLASYGGVNYYYLNGEFVCSFEQVASNLNRGRDRVGIFSYGASYEINKVTLSELEAPKEEKMRTLTFTLFADFHYKNGMYMSTIADLESILARADESNSSFIMSAGDFCNDFKGSPELVNTYHNYTLSDGSILPAYNVYGNHELETEGNSMANVTKTLTNDEFVIWGTEFGAFDENIGYYYFESEGFRIVCIDTQYSYNPTTEQWEHNAPASWGAPSGNTKKCSLGPVQLEWLERVLTDAAEKDIPCIVVGHDGMSGLFATSSADAATVRKIFRSVNSKNPGTVLMCINGHLHTNNQGYNDGVFYLDMNTARNCLWRGDAKSHYNYKHTFEKVLYDEDGNPTKTVTSNLAELSMGDNTWFSADPLSAVITIRSDGVIEIDGTESSWIYDVVPSNLKDSCEPRVSSGIYWDCSSCGHLEDDGDTHWQYDSESHWNTCPSGLCNEQYNKQAHSFDCEVAEEKYFVSEKKNGDRRYYKSCICGLAGSETFIVPAENGGEEPTDAPTDAPTDEATEKPTEIPTEQSTKAPDNEKSQTAEVTSTPTDTPEKKGGCGSAIGVGTATVGVAALAAGAAYKKKRGKKE